MEKIWNDIVGFVKDGNNLYYIIGAAIAVLLFIVIIALAAKRKKEDKKRRTSEREKSAVVAAVAPAKKAAKPVAVKRPEVIVEGSKKDSKINKVVEVKAVPKKEKPVPPPAPEPQQVVQEDTSEKEEGKLKRPGVIQIYKDNGGKFRFRLKASNNETIAHSQGYTTKAGCKNGIKAVQSIVNTAETYDTTKANDDYKITIGQPAFEIYKDSEGKFRFRLRAANTNNVLASQGYTAKENCLNGIRSVKHVAHNNTLIDDSLAK
ncbi:MAG: YegP family protein [Clostridia bacterium]